jgi:hypothetical protein
MECVLRHAQPKPSIPTFRERGTTKRSSASRCRWRSVTVRLALEEWFDPARLKEDYVPKGFHLGPGPIKGHEFGLKLAQDDREALIAFLKTL